MDLKAPRSGRIEAQLNEAVGQVGPVGRFLRAEAAGASDRSHKRSDQVGQAEVRGLARTTRIAAAYGSLRLG